MEVQSFDNVWDALTDTPTEAANMTARSDLLIALQRAIGSWGLTQEAAAKRLGITRPRISDLLAGKISKFSLDALVNVAAQAGLAVEIRVSETA
ncbi:MAG: XRE family transcriptional regulator [Methylobacterium sp.]|uniref:helix-turn-helix domain-containing protein n=1 Tax=Methylobacterium sp. TaxID=409 RepID=UPI0025D5B9C2|nr:XRE family transcriptional regulator [Methylobacterium sp.]MBX9933542.1 XRE family transcriptional regulator [Methylobacterium sp.]